MQAVTAQLKDGFVVLTQENNSGGPRLNSVQVDFAQWNVLTRTVEQLFEQAAKTALSEYNSTETP